MFLGGEIKFVDTNGVLTEAGITPFVDANSGTFWCFLCTRNNGATNLTTATSPMESINLHCK